MQEILKKFSINDVQMYREKDEDLDFSIVEIWALAEGTNSHKNPFSREVLERDSHTFKGKPIVAKFDKWTNDVQAHELEEIMIGYVDPTAEIEFKEKEVDGLKKEFVVVKGLISKIYAKNIVDMFRLNNFRTVSCEFSCATQYEENDEGRPLDEFGRVMSDTENPILQYHICGITILGLKYNPSVRGTEIRVKQFQQNYIEEDGSLKSFVNKRNKKFNNNDLPIKELVSYKEKDKEDNMEEEKKFSESGTDKEEKDIIMEEVEAKEKEMSDVVEAEEKEMAEDKEDIKEEEEKEMAENEEQPKEEEKEMGCGKEMSDDSEEKEMAEDDKEDEEKEEKEVEKKFSLDAFVDQSAILLMLEKETEQYKDLVEKMTKEFTANEIVEKFVQLSKENDVLKAEKEMADKEKQEKKFSAIMASVKEDLDEKLFSELSEEGKNLSLDQLGAFENKVKAFAYEATKSKQTNKEELDIMMFGASETTINNDDNQDVFDRLSKM